MTVRRWLGMKLSMIAYKLEMLAQRVSDIDPITGEFKEKS